MAFSNQLLCFIAFALLGSDASSNSALLRTERGAFLAPSHTESLILETAMQPLSELKGAESGFCMVWFAFVAIIPCCCFWIGLSAVGCSFYVFINPLFSVPLFVLNLYAVFTLWADGTLDKFMKGKIDNPTCYYIYLAFCVQALCGFIFVLVYTAAAYQVKQREAEQKAMVEKMQKAMEARMKNVAQALAKQAQEKSKVEVIAEIKKELLEIEEALHAEHKAYYSSGDFKAKCDAIFDGADANKNGVIDPDEFQVALAAAFEDDMIPVYKTELFKAFDMDNSKTIERDEFHTIMKYIDCHGPAKLKQQSIFEQAYTEPKIQVQSKVIFFNPK